MTLQFWRSTPQNQVELPTQNKGAQIWVPGRHPFAFPKAEEVATSSIFSPTEEHQVVDHDNWIYCGWKDPMA